MRGKLFAFLMLAVALALSGCGKSDNLSHEDEIVNELDPARFQEYRENSELDNKLGFVNYTQDQVTNEPAENMTMDRRKMADRITKIILQNKAFNEVATLVTDEDVLIAYQLNNNHAIDGERAAEIARKSALSVMPGYFEIIVSDNDVIIKDIQSLHNSSTGNKNYDNYKDEIIKEMEKSPQGFGDHER
jgi:hypothetical protein